MADFTENGHILGSGMTCELVMCVLLVSRVICRTLVLVVIVSQFLESFRGSLK